MLNYTKYGEFKGKILIVGFGSVGQAILPLIIRHLDIEPKQITVVELGENEDTFKKHFELTLTNYNKVEIVEGNLDEVLSSYVGKGDMIIDCSLNIDGITIVEWCFQNNVTYINTSIERWKSEPDETLPKLADRTLYQAHMAMRKMAEKYPKAATAVITHGANPGLVSHFTKQALLEMADNAKIDVQEPTTQKGWAKLSKLLGIKVIQIAERDTQITKKPKQVGEFVNTWSCEGFMAEGRAPAEMGWGTHEMTDPENGFLQGNTAYLAQPGMATPVKSWVPSTGQYNGFLVQHSEAITLSQYLSTTNYSPTIYYAYCPCDSAIASIQEFRGVELSLDIPKRIVKDSINKGMDELGVLLLGDNNMWYGSQLDIDEARDLLHHENATSLQVVASMLGAIVWMIKNPKMGLCEPEDLPFKEVLDVAMPYLGPTKGFKTDWRPTTNRSTLFKLEPELDKKNPLQFGNFTVDY